jgi:hypothetical protein
MTEPLLTEPKIEKAVAHLQGLIQGRYPEATFQTYRGNDPEGVYLDAIVDVEDTDEVMDLIIDPLLDIQVEQGLPVYVIPLQPIERVAAELQAQKASGKRSH